VAGLRYLFRDSKNFDPVLYKVALALIKPNDVVWDIGGNIGRYPECRTLANVPLTWMLERAEDMGLNLPENWRAQFPCDVNAPMVGTWRGFGLWFISRARRKIGRDASEAMHPSISQRRPHMWWEF
jgi:hypothetical protein